jgi:hypothetical protein
MDRVADLDPVRPATLLDGTWTDDGLTLTTRWSCPIGTVTQVARWTDTPSPDEVDAALTIPPVWSENGAAGQRSRLMRKGPFFVVVSTGPPTWWVPKFRVARRYVRFGWLNLAVEISRRMRK